MCELEMVDDEYCIGEFGDKRLSRTGKLLYSRMMERQIVCLRQLGGDWGTQKRFGRFLSNRYVTRQEIMRYGCSKTAQQVEGLHVLAIQDSSELNYQHHQGRTEGLGKISSSKGAGLFIHPVLVIDARNLACLGLAYQQAWVRTKTAARDYGRLPIEQKESYRWLQGAQAAKECLHKAAQITIIADRESDIYEEMDRIPDERTHLLTRVHFDRRLADGGSLFAWLDALPVAACYAFEVPARAANQAYQSTNGTRDGSGRRTAHCAHMEIRYGHACVVKPDGCDVQQDRIVLGVVEVREMAHTVVPGEAPVHWRLLTTHPVRDVQAALQLVDWYRQRWQIEQLFRILKLQGLDIESSQLEDVESLMKLASVAVLVAARTLQLTNAREGKSSQPASDVFEEDEIEVLEQLQPKLEGKTDKQKNPHPKQGLAWAAWLIARLGGWNGYANQGKPGPITMLHGLQRFASMTDGYKLAKMWV
jgi:Transposase DDE domain